jgi:hypothetical protein
LNVQIFGTLHLIMILSHIFLGVSTAAISNCINLAVYGGFYMSEVLAWHHNRAHNSLSPFKNIES